MLSDKQTKALRDALMEIGSAVAESGTQAPKPSEIFAPEQHTGALDPNTLLVLGSRGTGKTFWAGVLSSKDSRAAASKAYPSLGLDRVVVGQAYTGFEGDAAVTKDVIASHLCGGTEQDARTLWRCVVLRALQAATDGAVKTMGKLMADYNPEAWQNECSVVNQRLDSQQNRAVVLFDALDAVADTWERQKILIDALLQVAWAIRGYRRIRVKIFMRPDHLRNLRLPFVELPKIEAGATHLHWDGADLYGMLFARLGATANLSAREAFDSLLAERGVEPPPTSPEQRRSWPPSYDEAKQEMIFASIAGNYMGAGPKRGRTYAWATNHLADGRGEITPRSFLMLVAGAGRGTLPSSATPISADGIRHGLRAASKMRVDELRQDFQWIGRALVPLAGLRVPCHKKSLYDRWDKSQTSKAIWDQASRKGFLPPGPEGSGGNDDLLGALLDIGVLAERDDNRYDMPDLFRVAASLLKRGSVSPK